MAALLHASRSAQRDRATSLRPSASRRIEIFARTTPRPSDSAKPGGHDAETRFPRVPARPNGRRQGCQLQFGSGVAPTRMMHRAYQRCCEPGCRNAASTTCLLGASARMPTTSSIGSVSVQRAMAWLEESPIKVMEWLEKYGYITAGLSFLLLAILVFFYGWFEFLRDLQSGP